MTRSREVQDKLVEAERRLAEAALPPDFADLRRLIDAVGAEGRLEDRWRQQSLACKHEDDSIRSALHRLMPQCPVPFDQIHLVRLPSTEAIESHRQKRSKSDTALDQCTENLHQARLDLTDLNAQVAAFAQGLTVPSESTLITKRADRDAGLYQVRIRLAGQQSVSDDEFIARYVMDPKNWTT